MDAPMLDSRIRKRERIRLPLLAVNGVLADYTFVECRIEGPAVVVTPDCQFVDNTFADHPTAFLWPVDTEARPAISGIFILSKCLFEGCLFVNVGFAGPIADIERWRDVLLAPRA
jgi:hypothetical protein